MADEEHFLVCKSCGAKHAYSPGDQSIKCEFCGTITPLTADYDMVPGLDEVSGIIPLTVERKAVELALYEQMSLGTYTPEDMIERSQIISCKAQFFPFYRFDGSYEGTWTASFGYDRSEPYTSWESDGQGNRRPVTRHRTVTDWSPANGRVQGSFCLAGYAGEQVDSATATFLETHAELDDATSDIRSFSAGIEVESFVGTEREVMDARVDGRIAALIEEAVRANAQGDRQRDWHWSVEHEQRTTQILVPAWHVAFSYLDQTYNLWVSGSNAGDLKCDPLPEDNRQQTRVTYGFFPFAVAAVGGVAAALWLNAQDRLTSGGGWLLAAIAAAFLGYGALRRSALISYSRQTRQALLEFQKASAQNLISVDDETASQLNVSFQKPQRTFLSRADNQHVNWIIAAAAAGVLGVTIPEYASNTPYRYSSQTPSQSSSYGGGTSQSGSGTQGTPETQPTQTDQGYGSGGQSAPAPDTTWNQPSGDGQQEQDNSGSDPYEPAPQTSEPQQQNNSEAEKVAAIVPEYLMEQWNLAGNEGLSQVIAFYGSQVDYYGSLKSNDAVVRDKLDFARRWDERQYRVRDGSVRTSCQGDRCSVYYVLEWYAHSTSTGRTAEGVSKVEYDLQVQGEQVTILREAGQVLERTTSSDATTPPPAKTKKKKKKKKSNTGAGSLRERGP